MWGRTNSLIIFVVFFITVCDALHSEITFGGWTAGNQGNRWSEKCTDEGMDIVNNIYICIYIKS